MDQKQGLQASEDEIDLFELWEGLVQEKLTIFYSFLAVVVIAVIYLLMAPKKYEVRAELSPPLASEVSKLNYLDITNLTPNSIYQAFILNVSPRAMAERLSKEPDVLALFETTEKDVLIKNIMNAITIVLPEESKKKLLVDTELITSVIVTMDHAEDALTFANMILNNANELVQQQLLTEQLDKIETQIIEIDRRYHLTLLRLKNENSAEIGRLILNDNQKKAELKEEIEGLRVKAELDRRFKIELLESDLQLATMLNIQKPMDSLDYGLRSEKKAIVELKGVSPSRYWMGIDVLNAEIKSLKSRESNDPFILELTELKHQLALLTVNEKVEILKTRTDFIPFSSELRELQSEKDTALKALQALQNRTFNSYKMVSSFVKPTHSIKPQKMLVLAVAGVLGIMLGIFIALIRRAIKKRKEENGLKPT